MMEPDRRDKLIKMWEEEVYVRAEEVDLSIDKGGCWESLAFGFFMAKGVTDLEECHELYVACAEKGCF